MRDPAGEQHEWARARTVEAKRRTHLANERTYAAWVRTALALVALGVGIAGYFHLIHDERARTFVTIGFAFVLGGALMGVLAAWGYRQAYKSIEQDRYGTALGLTLLLGAIPVVIGLVALLLIVLR